MPGVVLNKKTRRAFATPPSKKTIGKNFFSSIDNLTCTLLLQKQHNDAQTHERGGNYIARLKTLSIKKKKSFGDDLLSQGAAPQVPSALAGLTAGFEM
jgi:hypothetical protein